MQSFYQDLFLVMQREAESERARFDSLVTKAQICLATSAAYIGFILNVLFPGRRLWSDYFCISTPAFVFGLFLLFTSVILSMNSLRIRRFEALFSPAELIENGEIDPKNAQTFWEDRLIDAIAATEKNRSTNNDVAKSLQKALFLLTGTLVLHIASALTATLGY